MVDTLCPDQRSGRLRSVEVTEGQEVKAERDGTVAKIHAQAGESLAVDQKIIEFG